MKITVKGSTMVKPTKETPSGGLWLSNLDLVFSSYHTKTVYFYRSSAAAATGLFDAAVLKAALGRALVDFFPFAGRLREDDNGRIEIECNGEGAAFVEAECDGAIAHLGGFCPNTDVTLVPTVDYSAGISSFPLFLAQLTRFACGGASLGVATEHHVVDGVSALHFINTWSGIASGLTAAAAAVIPPSFDRRLLAARDPPRPRFPHVEHHQPVPPAAAAAVHPQPTICSTFRLTPDQVNALKRRCEPRDHTTYEVVAGHVWRCFAAARGFPGGQQTKLQLPVETRRRLLPPLPPGYFGNAIFLAGSFATSGELASKPLSFAAGKVREAIRRMDGEYLRSALDYMELHPPRMMLDGGGANHPIFRIISWVQLPFYQADFGWGKPAYVGPGAPPFEGKSYLCVDPENEGSLLLIITLNKNHMPRFEKLLYHDCTTFTISKI